MDRTIMRGRQRDHSCLCSLVLVILGLLSSATITTNVEAAEHRGRAAWERQRVNNLPGQPHGVNFSQYAGYVTVNKKAGRSLFYWLIESPEGENGGPNTRPLVLWLNGGPGCSSIAYGASEEVGPFRVSPDGKNLTVSPYAWNQEANLLFLDSPAGVGFSYSNTDADVRDAGDRRTARDAYVFLRIWFKRFPHYKKRPFYIAGESYAGHYIPELAQFITLRNRKTKSPTINFKGFLLGNPLLDDYHDNVGCFEYWWTHGLISDTSYQDLNKWCLKGSFLFPDQKCNQALFDALYEFGDIDPYDINGTPCNTLSTLRQNLRKPLPFRYRGTDACSTVYTIKYMNRIEVQKALHVRASNSAAGTPSDWKTCSNVVRGSWTDSPKSMLPVFKQLISAGIQIWVFSGDTDAVLPLTATRHSLKALKLNTTTKWYAWYDSGKVAGWSQVYQGLTYVTVRGAGHEVPLIRPRQALVLFQHFLRNQPLPDISHGF